MGGPPHRQSQHIEIYLILLTVFEEVYDVDDTDQVQGQSSKDNHHLCMKVGFYRGESSRKSLHPVLWL